MIVTEAKPAGTWREVLGIFFRLGLTSFGGPVAHLGYFREEFVARLRWLDGTVTETDCDSWLLGLG